MSDPMTSLKCVFVASPSPVPHRIGCLTAGEASVWSGGRVRGDVVAWTLARGAEGRVALQPRAVLLGVRGDEAEEGALCLGLSGLGQEESSLCVVGTRGSTRLWEQDAASHAAFGGDRSRIGRLEKPRLAVVLSDGLHAVVAGECAELEVLSLQTGAAVLTLAHGHHSWMAALCAVPALGAPEERRPPVLASVSRDGALVFWSLELRGPGPASAMPVCTVVLPPHRRPQALAVSRDGRVLAVAYAGGGVELYCSRRPRLLHALPDECAHGLAFAGPCDRFLVCWGGPDKEGARAHLLPHSYLELDLPQFGASSSAPQQNDQYAAPRRRPFLGAFHDSADETGGTISAPAPAGPRAALASSGGGTAKTASAGSFFHRSHRGVLFQSSGGGGGGSASVATIATPVPSGARGGDRGQLSPPPPRTPSPRPEEEQIQQEREETAAALLPDCCDGPVLTTRLVGGQWAADGAACVSGSLVLAGAGSLLYCWELPAKVELASGPVSVAPVAQASVEDGWQTLEKKETDEEVTVVLAMSDGRLLVEGLVSGRLRVRAFPPVHGDNGRLLPGIGHSLHVTALWAVGDGRVVSGGADGRVCVWQTGPASEAAEESALLHSFAGHSGGPVLRVVGVGEGAQQQQRWRHCLLTVGRDRSVHLYSLLNYSCLYVFAGHSGPVEALVWRHEQDYLIVGCGDGSVAVWELGTGALLQSARGGVRARQVRTSGPNLLLAESGGQPPDVAALPVPLGPVLSRGDPTELRGLVGLLLPWALLSPLALKDATLLGLQAPPSWLAVGQAGPNALSFAVPSARPWTSSGRLSGLCMLALSALLGRLAPLLQSTPVERTAAARLLALVAGVLADAPPAEAWPGPPGQPHLRLPSLALLAVRWQDPSPEVQVAARALFSSVVDHLSPGALSRTLALYRAALGSAPPGRSRARAALVLAALAARGCQLSPPVAARTAETLLGLVLEPPTPALQLAGAELLGRMTVPPQQCVMLLERLLRLSLARAPPRAAAVCWGALLRVGAAQPEALVRMLSSVLGPDAASMEINAALTLVRDLARAHPAALVPHLALLVGLTVRPLDPNLPNRRKACLAVASATLDALVRRFPMIAFHGPAQRVAVGTASAHIVLYDLGTASETARLEGHRSAITAVAFSPNGKNIASFALAQSQIKIWGLASSFFGFGSTPHCTQTVTVDPPNEQTARSRVAPSQMLEDLELKWQSDTAVNLGRSWVGNMLFQVHGGK